METTLTPAALPRLHVPFVGRRNELPHVIERLSSGQVRLISLTGPGGIGKSRLAEQAITTLVETFPDGMYRIDITTITEATPLLEAIAQAVGLREAAGVALSTQLHHHLHGQRALLFLDNCEQLNREGNILSELLTAAPQLCILATSRVALQVPGEYEFRIKPLAVPTADLQLSPQDIPQWDALQLLVGLAQAAHQAFRPNAADLPVLAALCRRLDGIPLALELAARQVGLLGPRTVLERMTHRTSSAHSSELADHYEALNAAIAWSYAQLDPAAQDLLRHLTVFAGGATLQAIEAVCSPAGRQSAALIDALGTLLEQHMARRLGNDSNELRVGLLETIRHFGQEQLIAHGESRALQRRHAEYFLLLAEQAALQLGGPEQDQARDRLEQEHDNLRAALSWSLEPYGDPAIGLRLATALMRFWMVRGYLREGRMWLDQMLAETAAAPAFAAAQPRTFQETRARALLAAGQLAHHQRDAAASTTAFNTALALCRTLGLAGGEAHALRGLGNAAVEAKQLAEARALYAASLAIAEQLGLNEQIGSLLNNMGLVALYEHDYTQAGELLDRCLAVYCHLGDSDRVSALLSNRGLVALRAGDWADARRFLRESLERTLVLGDAWGLAHLLGRAAELALATGTATAAAWLLGAAESYPAYQEMLDKSDRAAYDALQAGLQQALPETERNAAYTAGSTADRDTVLRHIRTVLTPL